MNVKKKKSKILIYRDNTPAHLSIVEMTKINKLKFESLYRSACWLDLAPSDYSIFFKLKNKKWFGGQPFENNEKSIDAINYYF